MICRITEVVTFAISVNRQAGPTSLNHAFPNIVKQVQNRNPTFGMHQRKSFDESISDNEFSIYKNGMENSMPSFATESAPVVNPGVNLKLDFGKLFGGEDELAFTKYFNTN